MPARSRPTSVPRLVILIVLLAVWAAWLIANSSVPEATAQNPLDFKNFEAPQVHPLAITPDGTRLLATNTPNGTLSVFHITGAALTLLAEVPVGLEPVSVAARNNSEAWVTNWLSDSVSVVDLNRFRTTRSFDVGDEPTDVLFAGQQKELAFVCVSGTSEIKIFDPLSPTQAPQIIAIRAKQPRALARDTLGSRVFVSVFESGNQTTIVPAAQVLGAGGPPPPSPPMASGLQPAPAVGLIVRWNGSGWADETGNAIWSGFIPYTLADIDVVVINSQGQNPFLSTLVRGVGTHIGNATLDNTANRLYVANDEARNHIRFEPNLRGRFLNSRVSTINLNGTQSTIAADLNSHINHNNPAGSEAERALSLALPADLARAVDGTLYVAATGSAKVGVLDSQGVVQARIAVGQGPTGLALNEPRNLLYVLNRIDQTLSTIDLTTRTQASTVPIGFNPEPPLMSNGRRFLYDASLSAHGDVACASCHFSGHRDGLAWDLGDPQGQMQVVNGGTLLPSIFHPMKGPMTTQSLRGIIGTEPLHWRGDRAALGNFNAAFPNLLGGPRQLTGPELGAFTAFIRSLTYPPNPLENLDRTLPNPATGPSAARGAQLFNTGLFDGGALTCNQCHTALPGFLPGTNRLIIPALALQESQDFKVPQLRGMYQKLGMLNAPGEQIMGFGFLHDGSIDSLLNFLRVPVFTFQNDNQRRDVEQFVLAFDTGTAPAVGLQVTVNDSNRTLPSVIDRVNLLMAQANAGNCELVVKGVLNRTARAFLFNGSNQFLPDRLNEPNVTSQTLLQAAESELTFSGVPLGAGRRSSIDREGNGILDGDQPPQPNALDSAQFFVWQHYVDFLNRDPDPGGLGFWSSSIQQCGSDPLCIHLRRIGVSAAFFVELEFQRTGSFVYRAFKGGLGRRPAFSEFSADRPQIIEGPNLEQTKQAYALAFVQRGEFISRYAGKTSAGTFVDELISVIQQSSGADLSSQRSALIDRYNTVADMNQSRALVLRDAVDNAGFVSAEFNPSFVLMQYFGYLRRDPDPGGFDFWLDILNNRVPNNFRAMVCAFITSTEYQQRFGWSITRRNSDCSQL